MKKNRLCLLCYAWFSLCIVTTGCGREKNELVHDHAHEHGHEHGHDHEGHDHGDGDEIILSPAKAEQMGVETKVVRPSEFVDAVNVSGTIETTSTSSATVTAQASGIFTFNGNLSVGSSVGQGALIGKIDSKSVAGGDSNAAALAALNGAKRELDRLTPLYEKKLITAERYNAALTEYEMAKAAYSPAVSDGRVKSPIKGVITQLYVSQGQYVEKGSEIARVSDSATLMLTADVPDRYVAMVPSFKSAVIYTNNSKEGIDISDLNGRRASGTATVSTMPGYIPVVFTFDNTCELIPGSIVNVYLLGEKRDNVYSVPVGAVTEQQGQYFVYVKIDDEGYLKSPVKIGGSNGKEVEILSGMHTGDEVVISGVTALRLAETSGAVPEGHSHSH